MLGRVWRRILVPAIGASIPLGALTLVTFRANGIDEFLGPILTDPSAWDNLGPERQAEVSGPIIRGLLIVILLNLAAIAFINLATHHIVGAEIAGKDISSGSATRKALSRLLPLVSVGVIFGIALGLGLILYAIGASLIAALILVPSVWLGVNLSATPQVMALERRPLVASLLRSRELVGGRWWPTLGFLLMVGFLGYAATLLIQLVAAPLVLVGSTSLSTALLFVSGTLIQGLIVAAIAVMTTMWYVDLRARKETLLSESLS